MTTTLENEAYFVGYL